MSSQSRYRSPAENIFSNSSLNRSIATAAYEEKGADGGEQGDSERVPPCHVGQLTESNNSSDQDEDEQGGEERKIIIYLPSLGISTVDDRKSGVSVGEYRRQRKKAGKLLQTCHEKRTGQY